jgi:Glycosyltransferase family 87
MNPSLPSPTPPASRRLLVLLGALLTVAVAVAVLARGGDKPLLPAFDFVQYWSAGRLNLHGQNPYDPELLYPLERQAGWGNEEVAVMMWNPPWTLTLVMPLGVLPSKMAQIVWLLLHLAIVMVCARAIWLLYGGPPRRVWLAWALALGFAPTLFLLMMGQISGLLLLGLTGFLWGERHNRPWVAGASAALCAVKPHLGILFAVALALEALRSRRAFGIALRGAVVLAAAALVPLAFNPEVWSQYRDAARLPAAGAHVPLTDWVHPTLGYELRKALPGEPFWAQFVPLGLALVALVPYWWLRRRSWNWLEELPRLTLVGALTACYGGWAFDLVVLLVPVLQAAVWLIQLGRPALSIAFGAAFVVENALLLWSVHEAGSQSNPWITPALLVPYVALALIRGVIAPAQPSGAEALCAVR